MLSHVHTASAVVAAAVAAAAAAAAAAVTAEAHQSCFLSSQVWLYWISPTQTHQATFQEARVTKTLMGQEAFAPFLCWLNDKVMDRS